jgi:CMP-N-acetylneuraminic acid synthetase
MSARHLCIIAARSGSKTIKDKNLLAFNSKSLVRMALDVAVDSQIFSRVYITSDYMWYKLGTDDKKSNAYTKIFYRQRPPELGTDSALMIDVIKDVLRDAQGDEQWVWLFQPTSPFRTVDDCIKIKQILEAGGCESLISFCPSTDNSSRLYTWKGGKAFRLRFNNYENKQTLACQLTRSGNFYITKREHILANTDSHDWKWEIEPYYSYVMGGIDPENATVQEIDKSMNLGCNIDGPRQWELAKGIVRRGEFYV